MGNKHSVGPIIAWHEFGNTSGVAQLELAMVMCSGEEDAVTNAVDMFRCMVLVHKFSLM